jgi:hypothetical protein
MKDQRCLFCIQEVLLSGIFRHPAYMERSHILSCNCFTSRVISTSAPAGLRFICINILNPRFKEGGFDKRSHEGGLVVLFMYLKNPEANKSPVGYFEVVGKVI